MDPDSRNWNLQTQEQIREEFEATRRPAMTDTTSIVNIEFCTDHGERYSFPSQDAALSFLRAIACEFDKEMTHWTGLGRQGATLFFRHPGCLDNIAVLHAAGDELPFIEMPSRVFTELAAKCGGEPLREREKGEVEASTENTSS